MRRIKLIKTLILAILALTITSTLILAKPASAQQPLQTIFIQPDGTVSPNTAPIHHSGNTYTFTGNIYGAIKILKSNVILNGAGYTLTGPFNGNSSDIWVVGTGPDPNKTDEYTIGVDLSNSSVKGVKLKTSTLRTSASACTFGHKTTP